jgi:hypothetical protein
MPFDVQNISGSITSDSQDGSTDFPSLVSSGNNYYTVTAFRDVEGTQQASIEYTVLLNGECSRFEFTEVHHEGSKMREVFI